MASTSSIEAGRAFLRLLIDDAALAAGLDGAIAKIKKFGATATRAGAALTAVGAAITAPLGLAVQRFSAIGSELNDMSARTGVAVEALSFFRYAAQQTGTDLGTVEKAVRRMQQRMDAANTGNAEAVALFDRLGLSLGELANLSPDEQFSRIGAALAEVDDVGTRAALTMQVFGKSGAGLTPLLSEVDALKTKFGELGIEISTETAAAADAFGDSVDDMKAVGEAFLVNLGAQLAPAAGVLVQLSTSVLQFGVSMAEALGPLAPILATVGVAATAAGVALLGIGAAANTIGAVRVGITSVAAVLPLLTAGYAGLSAGITAAGATMLSFTGICAAVSAGLTAVGGAIATVTTFLIANPIGLIFVAIGAAIAGALYYLGAFGDGLDETAEAAKQLKAVTDEFDLGPRFGDTANQINQARTELQALEADMLAFAEANKQFVNDQNEFEGIKDDDPALNRYRAQETRREQLQQEIEDLKRRQEAQEGEANLQTIEQRAEAEKKLQQELAEIRIRLANEGLEEELALMRSRFAEEAAELEKLGIKKEQLAEVSAAREAEIRERFAQQEKERQEREAEQAKRLAEQEAERQEREAERAAELAKQREEVRQGQRDEIEDLELAAKFEPPQDASEDEKQALRERLQRAQLELAEERELREVADTNQDPALIRREYELKREALERDFAQQRRELEKDQPKEFDREFKQPEISKGVFASAAAGGAVFAQGPNAIEKDQLSELKRISSGIKGLARVLGQNRGGGLAGY